MKQKINSSMLFLAVLSVTIAAGCKKSSTQPPSTNASVAGFWSGASTVGNQSQIFKNDGTTVAYDFYNQTSTDTATCLYKGYGTYKQSGSNVTFSVTYTSVNQTFTSTATINSTVTPNTMSGSYSGSGNGTFSMTRQ